MDTLRTARRLGWFSIGLGLTQLLAPVRLGKLIGVGDRRRLMRAMGVREILHGLAVFANPKAGTWSRVAGDALDTGLLVNALTDERNDRGRVAAALVAVLPIGVLDLLTARRLQQRG